MNVVLFGGTGMVGQGVLRECLLDPSINAVLAVGRNPTGQQHTKLRDLVVTDLLDLSSVATQVAGFDACFFCLGISSAGMKEADYNRITYSVTLHAAQTLLKCNPGMTFVFVSGAGADSTEQGRVMWARIKGATENAVLALPFHAVYVFRPAMIIPLHGIRSRTSFYNLLYHVLKPLLPLVQWVFPRLVTTTEQMGRAMIRAARSGFRKRIIESGDIPLV